MIGDKELFVALVLCGVPAAWFTLEHVTKWRVFTYLPPLVWIYSTPVVLRALGILPDDSLLYKGLKTYLLPFFVTMLVMTIDLKLAVTAVGRAMPLMLIGTAGVILGAPIAYSIVSPWLDPMAWTGYGALAGSWIGGTANLAAVGIALETPPELMGLAILTDQIVFFFWLPMLIMSRGFAEPFNRWTRARPIPGLDDLAEPTYTKMPPRVDFLVMLAAGIANVWMAVSLSKIMPEYPPFLSQSTWLILLVTTGAIAMSFTPLRQSRQAEIAGNSLLYVFVATMGASASIAGLASAPVFVAGGFIWALIHGVFVLVGAKLLRLDVHVAALASVANLGGVASSPVVAAAHRQSLVPAAILLAAFGNVIGNYGAILAGHLCRLAVGG